MGQRRPGMTIVEAVVAAGGLGIVLWLLSGWYAEMLDRARANQAADLIRTLDRALAAYSQTCGAYPPGRADGTVDEALEALLSAPRSSALLATIEVKLLRVRDGRPRCCDPWGRRLRYLTGSIGQAGLRLRVAHNDGRPIIESAGADGQFGDAKDAAAADDISSDAPGMGDPSPQATARGRPVAALRASYSVALSLAGRSGWRALRSPTADSEVGRYATATLEAALATVNPSCGSDLFVQARRNASQSIVLGQELGVGRAVAVRW